MFLKLRSKPDVESLAVTCCRKADGKPVRPGLFSSKKIE